MDEGRSEVAVCVPPLVRNETALECRGRRAQELQVDYIERFLNVDD